MKKQYVAYTLVGLLIIFGLASFLAHYDGSLVLGPKQQESTDPRMSNDQMAALYAGTWVWDTTLFSDNSKVLPKKPGVFTLTFSKTDGKNGDQASAGDQKGRDNRNSGGPVFNAQISGTTDCNGFGGPAAVGTDNTLEFGPLVSTQMYCAGSQESAFMQSINEVNGFVVDENGDLILTLKNEYGAIYLKRK